MTRWLANGILAVSLIAWVTIGASTSHAAVGELLLDVPGDGLGFHTGPFDPLRLANDLAPGGSFAAVVGVQNNGGPSSDLSLKFLQIEDRDLECSPAEAPVDLSCGVGPGELAEEVRFEIRADLDDDADDSEFGAPVFEGTIDDLADGITLGDDLSSGEEWFFHITARLPADAGNETMTDSLAFDLEWRVTGDTEVIPGDGSGGDDPGIPGELLTGAAPENGPGSDVLAGRVGPPADPDVAGTGSGSKGLLPLTGADGIRLATVGALALLLSGLAIRAPGRRRLRRRQG